VKRFFGFFLTFLAITFLAVNYFFSIYIVSDNSLLPALDKGSRVLVLNQNRKIERGDLVVFINRYDGNKHYIQRVVGMPGDVIEFRRDKLIVSSSNQNSSLLYSLDRDYPQSRSLVSDDSYYLLGDNLSVSKDSRLWGLIKREDITGVAIWQVVKEPTVSIGTL